jgi:hypothetical protein
MDSSEHGGVSVQKVERSEGQAECPAETGCRILLRSQGFASHKGLAM